MQLIVFECGRPFMLFVFGSSKAKSFTLFIDMAFILKFIVVYLDVRNTCAQLNYLSWIVLPYPFSKVLCPSIALDMVANNHVYKVKTFQNHRFHMTCTFPCTAISLCLCFAFEAQKYTSSEITNSSSHSFLFQCSSSQVTQTRLSYLLADI